MQRYLPARVEHVGHERRWRCCSRCIDDVRHYGRKRRSKSICDDSTGSGPSENLNLSLRIQNDITTSMRIKKDMYRERLTLPLPFSFRRYREPGQILS